jgi:hypothetical protein
MTTHLTESIYGESRGPQRSRTVSNGATRARAPLKECRWQASTTCRQ